MTRKRLELGALGLALTVLGFVAGTLSRQARAQGQGNGGHFRLELDGSGNIKNCWNKTGNDPQKDKCRVVPAATGPRTNVIEVRVIPTDSTGKDPCFITNNGTTFEVPCS